MKFPDIKKHYAIVKDEGEKVGDLDLDYKLLVGLIHHRNTQSAFEQIIAERAIADHIEECLGAVLESQADDIESRERVVRLNNPTYDLVAGDRR